jgi:hypothetical protein
LQQQVHALENLLGDVVRLQQVGSSGSSSRPAHDRPPAWQTGALSC